MQGANSDWLNTYHDLVAGYGDRVYQWQQAVIAQQAGEIQARLLKAKDIIGEVAVYANEVGRTDFELSLDALVLANWGLYDGNRLGNEGTVQLSLDLSFAAARFALQRYGALDGQSYRNEVNARTETYKRAVSNAFNASFTVAQDPDGGRGNDWDLVSVHFARQGFEATARAFEKWTEQELESVRSEPYGVDVDRFDLFTRIMGHTTLENHYSTQNHFAEAKAYVGGGTIEIYKRPEYWLYPMVDGTVIRFETLQEIAYANLSLEQVIPAGGIRQAVLTPNNLIHEFGHLFSRFASTYANISVGGIEYELSQRGIEKGTRDGMGVPNHAQYFAPAFWSRDFEIRGGSPDDTTLTYQEIVDLVSPDYLTLPEGYLCYDLFGDDERLWGQFSPWSDSAVRIDSMTHNHTNSASETTADSFVSWVRGRFTDTVQGQQLQSLYDENIGMFIRNAVVCHMTPEERAIYEDYVLDLSDVERLPVTVQSDTDGLYLLRSSPSADPQFVLNNTQYIIGQEVRALGQLPVQGVQNVNNWVLIETDSGRRFWIADTGLSFSNGTSVDSLGLVDVRPINRPLDPYDFMFILGGI